jgi:CcmD family protein
MHFTCRWINDVMMRLIVRPFAAVVLALMCVATLPLIASAQTQEPPSEFTPIDQLPPTEPFPAAPLLIAAYAVVLVVLFLYLLSVARRLTVVQREIERLEADVRRTGRP